MGEDNAAGANGDNHQLRADAGGGDQWRGDPARGDGGHGRRTQRDTQHRGDRPRHKQRRHVRFVHDRGDVFIHAAIHQHLLEGAAAADDQQHHGDDFNRRGQGIVDLLHGAAAVQTEGEQGNQYRNQGGHNRVAEELGNWQEGVAFRQDHLSHGAHRHQDHRNQRGPDADAKAWHLFFSEHFRVMQAFRDRLIYPFQEARKHRSRQDNRRDSQNGAVEQRFAHIGMEDGGDRGRTRMRRQEAVGDGERGCHRYADVQQRNTGRGGDGEHQRQHQHEAHFIEQGEANGEAGQDHRPLNMLLTELIDKRGGDTLGAAAVCQQLTEHSAEAHDQREAAKGAANAVFDGDDHFIQWHTLH